MQDDKIESTYKGSVLLRLLSYMKPYLGQVIFCLFMVLGLTALELYRPVLIGDAIDLFEEQGSYDIIIETAVKYGIVLVLSFFFTAVPIWQIGRAHV